MFGEENILGWKLKQAGYKTVVTSKYKLTHTGGHSIKKSRTKKKTTRKYAEESLQLYIKEYLKCNVLQQKLFHYIFWIAQFEQDIVLCALRLLGR